MIKLPTPSPSSTLLPTTVLFAAVSLVAQREQPATPEVSGEGLTVAWLEANKLARRHKAPILAFVLPEREAPLDPKRVKATRTAEAKVGMLMDTGAPPMATRRDVLLRQVQLLRGRYRNLLEPSPDPVRERMVFALTVPVFATGESCRAKPGETVVLLSPQGKRLQGFALDLLDREAFLEKLGAELFSEEALQPRLANIDPVIRKRVDDLANLTAMPRLPPSLYARAERLRESLGRDLAAAGPLLVTRNERGELQPHRDLHEIEKRRAPFGSQAEVKHAASSCPTCGMGYTPPELCTVLKLVGP